MHRRPKHSLRKPHHRRQTSQLMSVTTRSPDRAILYEAIMARLRRADESVPDVVSEAVDETRRRQQGLMTAFVEFDLAW